jgi:hypothetical protein
MRMVVAIVAVVALAAAGLAGAFERGGQPEVGYAKVSPFEAVRWEAGWPEVMVGGEWYGLVSIDGVSRERLVEFAREEYGERAVKRFEEDLVQVMSEMGSPPGLAVDLVLRRGDGQEVAITDVVMTEENRAAIWKAAVDRERAEAAAAWMTRADVEHGLDELAALLARKHSYAAMRAVDWRGAIAGAKAGLPERMRPRDFGALVAEVIAPIGDGHAGVVAPEFPDCAPYLPFLPVGMGAGTDVRVVAVKADRSGLVDAGHPYVRSIDGVEIGGWLAECRKLVPHGSPQLVLDRSCRQLRSVGYLRERMGLAGREEVEVELEDEGGGSKLAVRLAVSKRKAEFGSWPRRETGRLAGGVGYVRLEEMGEGTEFLDELWAELTSFAGAPGIVIDVRGNGGGSRAAIQLVADFVMGAKAAPIVYNASRPLMLPGEMERELAGRMASRFLYPADGPEWTADERAAIAAFAGAFRPEVELPEDRFGAWHYAVMSPTRRAGRAYAGRVVVLSDAGCFSATDVFLAAMKEIPGVMVVGMPSGGGSGLAERHDIADERASVRLSTMVSFQPDGSLFEGRGVMPDVVVQAEAGDLVEGGGDAVLEAALREIDRGK